MRPKLGLGVVGFGWMGQAHSRSYLRIPTLFPERAAEPELVVCGDTVPERPRPRPRSASARSLPTGAWTPGRAFWEAGVAEVSARTEIAAARDRVRVAKDRQRIGW